MCVGIEMLELYMNCMVVFLLFSEDVLVMECCL